MGEIVSLAEHKPHLAGVARCAVCGHEWSAVAAIPVPASLECPACGLVHGFFKYPICENDGVERFECLHCGGQVFNVRREGVRCVFCGFLHTDYLGE